MDSEALLKAGFGSAEGCTRVRARTWRGNRGGSDNRLRRAWSFVERSAALGCGDGRLSSGREREGLDSCAGDAPTFAAASSFNSPSSGIATVLWKRACIRWLCGIMPLRKFFAAAYGHEGRCGRGGASNCEAHLERGIRFMKTTVQDKTAEK